VQSNCERLGCEHREGRRFTMQTVTVKAGKPRGRPFPSGAAHPRYKGGGRKPAKTSVDGVTLYQLFRSYTEDAARLLAAVMNDRKEDMELRVRAAAMILQRGWGDAPKHLITHPIDDTTRAGELSEADILAIVRRPPVTIEGEPQREGPPSRGDEPGSLTGTGSINPSPEQSLFANTLGTEAVVLEVLPDPKPLPLPDIPSFLPKDTPPSSEREK
jgi:hypothetical protein